jgi:hypothetical protein
MTHKQICIDVSITVMSVAELMPMLLIGLLFLVRHVLDVRRWKAWDSDWGVTGPQWSRR